MKGTLAVILPAYNEADNLPSLVRRWLNQKEALRERELALRLLIVNDGSQDDTLAVAEALAREEASITVLDHGRNKGLGQALRTGLTYGLSSVENCACLAVMDSDNTHDPRYVAAMVDALNQDPALGTVIASRYQKGSAVVGVPSHRLLISYGARLAYTLLLKVPGVRDYTCGYRLYEAEGLRKVQTAFGQQWIEEVGFTCMVELLYKLHLTGTLFAEVPFVLRYDEKLGASKMQVMRTSERSLALIRKLRRLRPC